MPRLEPHERARFYLTALSFICVATAALMARAVGDALFLSHLGSEPLPFMYIGGAAATGLGSYACARAAKRFSTAGVGVTVTAILIIANVAAYLCLNILPNASRVSAYLLADLAGKLPLILYWALASEVFDAAQSRRLFGLLGAAGTAACLPAGLAVGPLARRLGTEPLLLLVAGLMVGFILAVQALVRREKGGQPADPRAESGTLVAANAHSSSQLHRNRQFLYIAALAAVTSLVQTLVDYEFKTAFAPLYQSAALAALFGKLYALTSVAALFIQLFLIHRILQRGGVLLSLSVLPAGLLLSSGGILGTGAAGWVFGTKALDITMTLTLNGTSRQMLYRGIRSESRMPARALAEGLYQPLAIGLAGSVLVLAPSAVTVRAAAAASILGCAVWLLLARGTHNSYVSGLLDSLRARRYEADIEPFAAREPALDAYVRETLASAPDEEVIYLAAVLPQLGDFTGTRELRQALDRGNPRVKVAILDYLREQGGPRESPVVLGLTRHADPEVRRTAIRSAARGTGTGIDWLLERLTDGDSRVRAAAAAALVNTGLPDAVAAGRSALERMAGSRDPRERAASAEGLGDTRRNDLTPLFVRLLDDADEEVLVAALEACRSHPDPELVPGILPHLERAALAAAASDALVAVGPAALGPLMSAPEALAERPSSAAALSLPPILARIGDPEALPLLERLLSRAGPEDRTFVARSFAQLARKRYPTAPSPEESDRLVLREVRSAEARLRARHALGSIAATRLARDAVEDLLRAHLLNAFLLLDVRVQDVDMMALHSSLTRGSREKRSQALEVLHNVLPEAVKTPLLEVLGQADLRDADSASGSAAQVESLLEDRESEWIVAGALYAAAEMRLGSCGAGARRLLRHSSPVVRETALFALSRLEGRETFLEVCASLAEDPDEAVRKTALSLRGSCETGS